MPIVPLTLAVAQLVTSLVPSYAIDAGGAASITVGAARDTVNPSDAAAARIASPASSV